MLSHQLLRRCFVIGPMRDMARLRRLAEDIVRPLLAPEGFDVITPDEGDIGTIMDQVLLNLEQADILVADLTSNNPNVLYELGIYHAFGKPYLVVKDGSDPASLEPTPFDLASYRYHTLPFGDPATAQAVLRPLLTNILRRIDRQDWFSNPVTDFYRSPVAEIPTAVGLAKNYLKNFLDQLLPALFTKNESDDRYQVDVWVETGRREASTGLPEERLLSPEEREALTLDVLIPEKLKVSDHRHLSGLKNGGQWPFRGARVLKKGRSFALHYRQTEAGQLVLADLPTALSTLNESIGQRRRIHEKLDETEWLILEGQELERFASKCEVFRANLENEHPQTLDRVRIVTRWKP